MWRVPDKTEGLSTLDEKGVTLKGPKHNLGWLISLNNSDIEFLTAQEDFPSMVYLQEQLASCGVLFLCHQILMQL